MRARQGQGPGATSWYALIRNYTLQKYKSTKYKNTNYKNTSWYALIWNCTLYDALYSTRLRTGENRVEVFSAGRRLISGHGSAGFSPNLAFHPHTARILSCQYSTSSPSLGINSPEMFSSLFLNKNYDWILRWLVNTNIHPTYSTTVLHPSQTCLCVIICLWCLY